MKNPANPHRVVIDLGESTGPGRIKNYKIYLRDTPFGLVSPQ